VSVHIADGVVRRPAGPWTPAVHALLRWFEHVGFDGAPRVVGVDGDCEVLTFVPGEARGGEPIPRGDEVVATVGALLRRMHDAQARFVPPRDARWQALPRAVRGSDEVICHNDALGSNTIFRDGVPVALVDWELAAPGPRVVDLVAPASFWVPLRPDEDVLRHGLPTGHRPERLGALCDGYGLDGSDRGSFLDVVARVWSSWREAYRVWGGVERRERWRDAFDAGRCASIDRNLAWLAANRRELETGLA
jgi:aminoglycoside phosphotransferase (APT) family kinase protein